MLWLALAFAIHAPQAIVLIGGFCCDKSDVATCKVYPFQPVGDPCWCPGMPPDGGHVCL